MVSQIDQIISVFISFWITINSLWVCSWCWTLTKYFYNLPEKKPWNGKLRRTSPLFYRHKEYLWQNSIPKIIDYTMLIINFIYILVLITISVNFFIFG